MYRLDQYLVKKALAPSRAKAQELIQLGKVFVLCSNGQKKQISQSSYKISNSEDVIVENNDVLKFVSRGGLKLEGALSHIQLSVQNLQVFDVGQSTGGFTDCALQSGAKQVVGIDVGHGQLHEKLRQHPQLVFFEKLNIKNVDEHEGFQKFKHSFDLAVMDVSFISVTKVWPFICSYLKPQDSYLLSLIKPQFELSAGHLNKRGVVKDSKSYEEVYKKLLECVEALPLELIDFFESPILGGDGNKEFFAFLKTTN